MPAPSVDEQFDEVFSDEVRARWEKDRAETKATVEWLNSLAFPRVPDVDDPAGWLRLGRELERAIPGFKTTGFCPGIEGYTYHRDPVTGQPKRSYRIVSFSDEQVLDILNAYHASIHD